MGSYLSRVMAALRVPARVRWYPRPKPVRSQRVWNQRPVTHIHRKRWVRTRSLPTIPGWVFIKVMKEMRPEAFRHFPSRQTPKCFMDFPGRQESLWLLKARNLEPIRSPVTIKITPPQLRGSLLNTCPPTQEPPDPCAKETVLRALSKCNKGKRKFDGPLWFEIPDTKRRQSPEQRRPSAFKPLRRNGVILSLVPRPGPLRIMSKKKTLLGLANKVTKMN